ncbi:hypothetical protein HMPREF0063_12518 [Aeromicrobium marinum DSM 15272]|uniref:DUF222 domain-containing protein n=1 Tax=Aeromicrobium marinum DSM 15272 TaxID=585531 RepID=E2SEQ9_9ACTN|nr:HNH endonuclease [Aeromicrobium marinum]EFQ82356.1 hypothetical protein HMPREF0063_12518 [Aeromicrobium marinum DSM 15272]
MFEDVDATGVLAAVRAHDHASAPLHEGGASRVDAIGALDRLIRAAQAEQVRQILGLYEARSLAMGIGRGDASVSAVGEVSLVRAISPGAAGNQFTFALGLESLPGVFDLFGRGVIPESVARAVVQETKRLGPDDRVLIDAELVKVLPGLTPGRARKATRRLVIRIDAEAAKQRAERARADQRVSLFPDADGVAVLVVRGPAEQLVAVHEALDSWATGLRATGDTRTRGQIMCATLVERVTGVRHADTMDVEIGLVLDAKTLLGDGTTAELAGYGPISPDVADEIIARAHKRSVRRLLTDPVDGTLVGRDPRRRHFDGPLAGHIKARDRHCRQPGCECKIRDLDHVIDYQAGGPTTEANAQGLCKRSHTIKHQPGWSVRSDGRATIWRTPTGHEYRSDPPPLLGHLRQ